jgi:hypothetical protein
MCPCLPPPPAAHTQAHTELQAKQLTGGQQTCQAACTSGMLQLQCQEKEQQTGGIDTPTRSGEASRRGSKEAASPTVVSGHCLVTPTMIIPQQPNRAAAAVQVVVRNLMSAAAPAFVPPCRQLLRANAAPYVPSGTKEH